MDRLKQTYLFIESYLATHHQAPTQSEIGAAFGLKKGGGHYRVVRMEALGWLKRSGVRSIVLRGMK